MERQKIYQDNICFSRASYVMQLTDKYQNFADQYNIIKSYIKRGNELAFDQVGIKEEFLTN
ncbi:hypothetical protein PanWU01x14_008840 [Parasponia andersonii]|uniref:Uncharacterized protein n=1 Tax=Parasponia andersonii TaxID=3476 RepID=A0A2P5E281_PARAD|nr:hypothetical protein PanWU01x14_008840 [Parasponia andersonii]